MSTSIYWQARRPTYLCGGCHSIAVALRDEFGGEFPLALVSEHVDRLRTMGRMYERDTKVAAGRNPYFELADAIEEHGMIDVNTEA